MYETNKKIGIALSGGGIRATIFHLGVLKWMAENTMLEKIERISSVSGASLCIGLIYTHNKFRWPASHEYLDNVLPNIKKVILSNDIQIKSLLEWIVHPNYWNNKVGFLAKEMQKYWGIQGNLSDISEKPIWNINCSTFETGKRFRFSQKNMGDYKIGYVEKPKLLIADAIAASAGFPGLIGPYKLKTNKYSWKSSKYGSCDNIPKVINLWDGGVYDNLGLESIYKMNNGGSLKDGINYIIISNASHMSGIKKRKLGFFRKAKRLLEISMDQVEALRTRSVMDFIQRTQDGMYLKIGNSAKFITKKSEIDENTKNKLIEECITEEKARYVANYSTTLSKPSENDYDLILKHGYEVAKCTYSCYKKVL